MFGPLGIPELIVIFIVALVVFGPKKLPELGKSLGHGLREFNKAKNELKATWDEQLREAENHIESAKHTIHEPVRESISAGSAVDAANDGNDGNDDIEGIDTLNGAGVAEVIEGNHELPHETPRDVPHQDPNNDSHKEPPPSLSSGS